MLISCVCLDKESSVVDIAVSGGKKGLSIKIELMRFSCGVTGKKLMRFCELKFMRNCCSCIFIFFANRFPEWNLQNIFRRCTETENVARRKSAIKYCILVCHRLLLRFNIYPRSSTQKTFHRWFLYFHFCHFFSPKPFKNVFQYRMSTQNEFLWSLLCCKRIFPSRFFIESRERILLR